MSKTPRGVVNGTAITVAILAIILAASIMRRSCSRLGGHESSVVTTKALPSDTIAPTQSVKETKSTAKSRKSGAKESRQSKVYPERNVLDDKL